VRRSRGRDGISFFSFLFFFFFFLPEQAKSYGFSFTGGKGNFWGLRVGICPPLTPLGSALAKTSKKRRKKKPNFEKVVSEWLPISLTTKLLTA
jgi:hypothetical protein